MVLYTKENGNKTELLEKESLVMQMEMFSKVMKDIFGD